MRSIPFIALLLIAPAHPAAADRAAADDCAARRTAPEYEIYAATLAENPTRATARSIVTAQTEKLIADGTLTARDAHGAGEAAGKCLELLQ